MFYCNNKRIRIYFCLQFCILFFLKKKNPNFTCLKDTSFDIAGEEGYEGLSSETKEVTKMKQRQNLVLRLVAEKKRECDERDQKFMAARRTLLEFDMVWMH